MAQYFIGDLAIKDETPAGDREVLLAQIDALIQRVRSCDHLDDIEQHPNATLAARYSAFLAGAVHTLMQIRDAQCDFSHARVEISNS